MRQRVTQPLLFPPTLSSLGPTLLPFTPRRLCDSVARTSAQPPRGPATSLNVSLRSPPRNPKVQNNTPGKKTWRSPGASRGNDEPARRVADLAEMKARTLRPATKRDASASNQPPPRTRTTRPDPTRETSTQDTTNRPPRISKQKRAQPQTRPSHNQTQFRATRYLREEQNETEGVKAALAKNAWHNHGRPPFPNKKRK